MTIREDDYSRCPVCGGDVIAQTRVDQILEYFGAPAPYYVTEFQCPNCGWNQDEDQWSVEKRKREYDSDFSATHEDF